MELVHGTEADHRATYARAKANSPKGLTIWTGDLNLYLAENLNFMKENGLAKVTYQEETQASYYLVEWL